MPSRERWGKLDELNTELAIIAEWLRKDSDRYYTTREESIVQSGQRIMIGRPDIYPMADTLFLDECKRRNTGACELCKYKFRCWTE